MTDENNSIHEDIKHYKDVAKKVHGFIKQVCTHCDLHGRPKIFAFPQKKVNYKCDICILDDLKQSMQALKIHQATSE